MSSLWSQFSDAHPWIIYGVARLSWRASIVIATAFSRCFTSSEEFRENVFLRLQFQSDFNHNNADKCHGNGTKIDWASQAMSLRNGKMKSGNKKFICFSLIT